MRAFKAVRGCGVAASLATCLLGVTASAALASPAPTTDPFTQQATLTASDEIGNSGIGSAGALSHDGNTALVGGPQDDGGIGAAWVFVRKGSKWAEQAKLTGEGEIGAGKFGSSVALSSDGKTALIGGPQDNNGIGAAWVFVQEGSKWRLTGVKLTGKDAGGALQETHCDHIEGPVGEDGRGPETYCFVGHPAGVGASVALSADGATALVGGPGDNEGDGATWVFTRSGSTWRQHGEKLTGGGEQNEFINGNGWHSRGAGAFGESVALSSDGDTALIGGPYDRTEYYLGGWDESGGAVWTFTRTGPTWTQQGEKSVEKFFVGFGAATALSPDGNTALIGSATEFAKNASRAAVFTRSGSTWARQIELGSPLCCEPPEEGFYVLGRRVALSSDGSTALVDGVVDRGGLEPVPAAGVFRRSKTWIEPVPPTLEAPPGACGLTPPPWGRPTADCGVALSADASTALVGTTVFISAPAPVVASVSPREGFEAGDTTATITGSDFTNATAVRFGSQKATSFTVNSDSSITAVSPAGSGTVDVTVTNPYGTSLPWWGVGSSLRGGGDGFRYLPPIRPAVVTEPATDVTPESAILQATVTPNGAPVEDCHFEYGLAIPFEHGERSSVPCSAPGSGETPVAVSVPLTSLKPNHIYRFRIVAANRAGTSYGEEQQFVTPPG